MTDVNMLFCNLWLKIVHSIIYSENLSKLNLLRTNFSVRNRQVFDLYRLN